MASLELGSWNALRQKELNEKITPVFCHDAL